MTKPILCLTLIISLAWTFLAWSNRKDEQMSLKYEIYVECVREKYGGRTPYQVKEATGEYPKCDEI